MEQIKKRGAMKKTMLGLLLLSATVYGDAANGKQPPEKISYDTDLFRENNRVEFVNLEFLYWTVSESGMDYALKMKNSAWGDPTEGVGHYKVIDFGWRPGFRGNIGYFNAHHYWDVYAQFTYFKGSGTDHTHEPDSDTRFLNGTWPQPNFTDDVPLERAKSSVDFKLYIADAIATRRFFPNPHFRMRLFGGPTVAWIRQNWEIDYTDIEGETSHLHNHWRFTGAGIRAGLFLDWFMGKGGFYLTSCFSGAIYAGHYHNVSKQRSSFSNDGEFDTSLPLRNAHYHDVRLIPTFQLLAGPSWQMAFGRYRTELFAGYELNFWANLHEVYRTTAGAPEAAKQTIMSNALISIQGLTVRWNLDF